MRSTTAFALAGAWAILGAASAFAEKLPHGVGRILTNHCLDCHADKRQRGDLRLDSMQAILKGGESGPALVPGDPDKSLLIQRVVAADPEKRMPPVRLHNKVSDTAVKRLRSWIETGAEWPEGVVITPKDHGFRTPPADDLEITRRVHALLLEREKEEAGAKIDSYKATIPKTGVGFEMIAIPGGEFIMGSPVTEAHHCADEGPQVKRKVKPFWMGKFEVTWDEFEPFSITKVNRLASGRLAKYDPETAELIDAVSQPTAPYLDMTYGMGRDGYPAIGMTQHAASKYCQWLSIQTGHFYRLPTETEWEYACRAGTNTAYSFGDDPSTLGRFAVYWENNETNDDNSSSTAKVGSKLPNPWGLHDMHGNVAEWVLDEYQPDSYKHFNLESPPWHRAKSLYPRVVRGGSWDDDPEDLRSAARRGSSRSWKRQDPVLPQSIWYFSDAWGLGFRIVRSPEIPPVEELHAFWNSATGMTR